MASPSNAMPPAPPQPAWAAALDTRNGSWWQDLAMRVVVMGGGISAILFIVAIFGFIASQGIEFIVHRLDLAALLTGVRWEPTVEPPSYGALPLIAGTAFITLVAMAIAVPLAFGAAVYVGEFARGKTREWLKILIELLAAIPSVVWGVIGLHVMGKK